MAPRSRGRTRCQQRDAAALARVLDGTRWNVRIKCLGVWDTVGSLGVPWHPLQLVNRKHRFHEFPGPVCLPDTKTAVRQVEPGFRRRAERNGPLQSRDSRGIIALRQMHTGQGKFPVRSSFLKIELA